MSKVDSKKLQYAKLHTELHHPLTGTVGPRLQNFSDSAGKAVDMTLCEPWVLVEVPTIKDKKKTVKFLVPTTGFIQAVLAE
jgi:hypothetical protein